MKQEHFRQFMPTAQISINKSRLKVYQHSWEPLPVFYLENGQEFQIELHNPTAETVLAKIKINGKAISQGGLVLRPAERVWLDRYLDVAKKFKFETYEVSNTTTSKQAIVNNGDLEVEFFKELNMMPTVTTAYPPYTLTIQNSLGNNLRGIVGQKLDYPSTGGYIDMSAMYSNTCGMTTPIASYSTSSSYDFSPESSVTLDSLSDYTPKAKLNKSIETGRVEKGSDSNQSLQQVHTAFQSYYFHKVTYKLLPISQMVVSSSDINVRRYCTFCGVKQKPDFKFCPNCGTKA